MQFLTPARMQKTNAAAILALVEQAYGYVPGTLTRRSNARHIAHPRHLVAYLLVGAGMALSEVGRAIGRHHTTVINSCQFIERAAVADPELAQLITQLKMQIEADPAAFTCKPMLKPLGRRPAQASRVLKQLPDVASRSIPGMEELDKLILDGRGDRPRVAIEDLKARR